MVRAFSVAGHFSVEHRLDYRTGLTGVEEGVKPTGKPGIDRTCIPVVAYRVLGYEGIPTRIHGRLLTVV